MKHPLHVPRTLFVATAALALLGCGSSSGRSDDDTPSEEQNDVKSAEDEGGQEADPTVTKGGETWQQFDTRRNSYAGSRGTSHGEGCTVDCGGHDAGYNWAEANGIDDPDDCGGKSWSFEEGCRAYAKEQAADGDEGE
jgi:hypothetical protein